MAMTNSERQARFRARLKSKAFSGISTDDVIRAVKIFRPAFYAHTGEQPEAWDDWLVRALKPKGLQYWREFVPTSSDPDDYPDNLSIDDREFLARVGLVGHAVLFGPSAA